MSLEFTFEKLGIAVTDEHNSFRGKLSSLRLYIIPVNNSSLTNTILHHSSFIRMLDNIAGILHTYMYIHLYDILDMDTESDINLF